MGDPDQHHLGRLKRLRRARGLVEALLQHLPRPSQHRDGQLIGQRCSASPLLGRETLTRTVLAHDLNSGCGVHCLGKIGQNLCGIGAVLMQLVELPQGIARCTAKQRLEQIENAPAVGEPQHRPHLGHAHLASAHGNGLIKDGEAIAH